MMKTKTTKLAVAVGSALLVGSSFAAVKEGFDDATAGAELSALTSATWSGNGTITADTGTISSTSLKPISGNSANLLAVAGTVTCANSASANGDGATADFLVNIAELSDELEIDNADTVQIAVAAGTSAKKTDDMGDNDIPLCVYCKPASSSGFGNADWVTVGKLTKETWQRVTLAFNYTKGFCRVSLDGIPLVSDHGVKSADSTTAGGAWYKLALATDSAQNRVSQLDFVGSAKIDDVVVADTFKEDDFGEAKTQIAVAEGVSVDVSLNDLNKWGITPAQATTEKLDNTDLTVAEKVSALLDPTDGSTLTPKTMAMTAANTATVTWPCALTTSEDTVKNRIELQAVGGSATFNSVTVDANTKEATGTVTITPDDNSKVVKFRLKTK